MNTRFILIISCFLISYCSAKIRRKSYRIIAVRLKHLSLIHIYIYNRLLAIRNRKNGRTPFLKWLSEQIERDADQKDE